jgi:5'/3'-nucleotidase SurE
MRRSLRKLLTVTAATTVCALGQQASALNIALTNDDGWSTYGIHALYNALTAAGHNVSLAGPLGGQSGSSAAVDVNAVFASALVITKQADNIYSVGAGTDSAEPATAGAIAANIALQANGTQPDLLVSGINDGANVGPTTQISGTVGAAVVSIGKLIGAPVPAIAVSTDERCEEGSSADDQVVPDPADIPADCTEVADFVVELINELEMRPQYNNGKSSILPDGVALNINYPPVSPLGVKVASQGQSPYVDLLGGAASIEVACYTCPDIAVGESSAGGIAGIVPATGKDVKDSDSQLFAEGYITIVPIEADYTANAKALKGLAGTLEKFSK